jgi:hypothetical protein
MVRAKGYSRVKFSQTLDGLMTISHGCGIPCLLFEKPGAESLTWAKGARVRGRRSGELVTVTEEEKDDVDDEEASEYHEELAGSHGALVAKELL